MHRLSKSTFRFAAELREHGGEVAPFPPIDKPYATRLLKRNGHCHCAECRDALIRYERVLPHTERKLTGTRSP